MRRIVPLLVALLCTVVLAGCGAKVVQVVELNHDGSGQLVVTGTADRREVESLEGGIPRLQESLAKGLPAGWEFSVSDNEHTVVFEFRAAFGSEDELRQRLQAATGTESSFQWTSIVLPFYRQDTFAVQNPSPPWATWAVEAARELTDEPVVESVSSMVRWGGDEYRLARQPVSVEQRLPVQAVNVELRWEHDHLTQSVEILPAKGDSLFTPLQEWAQKAHPQAIVTPVDGGGARIVTEEGSPEGPDAAVSASHSPLNMFWERIAVRTQPVTLDGWVGPGVQVETVQYQFGGDGWWSTGDSGPPTWWRWPRRQDTLELTGKHLTAVNLVGYRARPALYVAWVAVPIIVLSMLIGLGIWVKRTRPRWSGWKSGVKVRWATMMNPQTACSACGKAMLPGETCAWGQVSATMSAGNMPPVGAWARLAWIRFVSVVTLRSEVPDVPWQASLLSLAVRSVVLAFLVDRFLEAVWGQVMRGIARQIPLFGLSSIPSVPAFGRVLLALLVSSAASIGLIYVRTAHAQRSIALAALTDAQWGIVLGAFSAWLHLNIWVPLAVAAIGAGVCWGQALLSAGLQRLDGPPQQLKLLQAAVGGVSVLGLIVGLSIAANRLSDSFM